METKMKTVIIDKPGKISCVERDKPSAGSGEILVKLKYVGFCGSDLSTYLGINPMIQYPRVPGHEISAEIEAIGKEVPEGFKAGEAVTVVPYTNCGRCPSCRRGREHACQFNRTLGIQRDGAMQEYLAIPWQKVLKAPALSDLELAMVEPLTVGFHAVERGRVTDSDIVVVMGCGMIGAGALAGSVRKGATVIAVDIDDHKLELAKELGAGHTINSTSQDLHEYLNELTGGDGPDVVIEAVGSAVTYRAAVDEVAFSGRVVCIGYSAQEVLLPVKFFVQRELDIMGSRNATGDDFRAVIAYLSQGTFPLEKMITSAVTPDEAAAAVKGWAENPGKVMKILVKLD